MSFPESSSQAGGSAVIRSPLLRVAAPEPPSNGLIQQLLREQQTLTAVERFARQHDEGVPAQARYYRDLIPISRPGPGQQYAFEVDLDACTGCKACVSACHSLNGLDEAEVWRTVGLLHGGSAEAPTQKTVTTSCHHCLDPACLSGCPVQAYEKDPVTGIVRHLDDQCIGCQYCTLMCPYDAPKYSKQRGIVRKCDMCSDRLAVGEAPACVQGCPNQAIAIRVVDQSQVRAASEAGTFLPGAPTPEHTAPATYYKSSRQAPADLLPADFYSVSPEHAHLPLVILLVLTQLAAGAFTAATIAQRALALPSEGPLALGLAGLALLLGLGALAASVFHLGRPLGAWRALLGLRTSWMSREALAFGLFAKVGGVYALSLAIGTGPGLLARLPGSAALAAARAPLGVATAAVGLAGVFCSAMIYAVTRRRQWRLAVTAAKFAGTSALLGAATLLLVVEAAVAWLPGMARAASPAGSAAGGPLGALGEALAVFILVVGSAKLLGEALALRHLRGREHTVGKRVAILMVGDLLRATQLRFVCGILGAVLLPLLWWQGQGGVQGPLLAGLMFALLLAGELAERYLFFTTAPPSRMPGALS